MESDKMQQSNLQEKKNDHEKNLTSLDQLNVNEDYIENIRPAEMEIGKYYRVSKLEFINTIYGKRAALNLVMDEDVDDGMRMLFLPPKFSKGKRKEHLHNIFYDSNKVIYISLSDLKINQRNGWPIPTYKFDSKQRIDV